MVALSGRFAGSGGVLLLGWQPSSTPEVERPPGDTEWGIEGRLLSAGSLTEFPRPFQFEVCLSRSLIGTVPRTPRQNSIHLSIVLARRHMPPPLFLALPLLVGER